MRHFEKVYYGGLSHSRQGIIFGVLKKLAEYFNFSLFWIRAIAIIFLLVIGFWPMLAFYLMVALIMKPKPIVNFRTQDEQAFYKAYPFTKKDAAKRNQRRYANLKRCLQWQEDCSADSEYRWKRKRNVY